MTTMEIENYRKLGLSDEFINILLYKSGRPKVNMKAFLECYQLTPKYLPKQPFIVSQGVTSDDVIIDGHHPILPFPYTNIKHHEGDAYYMSNMQNNLIYTNCIVPVIRYQIGMSGYLTCGPSYSEKEFCGTFYYFEPDSEYLLFSPTTFITVNKITACLLLGININYIVYLLLFSKGNWIVGEDPDPTVDGYPNNMGFNVEGTTKREQWYNVVIGFYNGSINPEIHYPDMYAGEDKFDQPLCEIAKSKNITCIILQSMTGETRVVTEVLDTRSRIESFDNLYFPAKSSA